MFNCEVSGKCERFQSVSGCGIKCVISHTDDLLKSGTQSDFIMNYQNHIKYVKSLRIYFISMKMFAPICKTKSIWLPIFFF